MKLKFLIYLLVMLTCCISISAQKKGSVRTINKSGRTNVRKSSTTKPTKEYKKESDGFEWYLVKRNGKMGAESKEGKSLIPIEYDDIYYDYENHSSSYTSGPGFKAKKINQGTAFYNQNGKCIIPHTRGYERVRLEEDTNNGIGSKYFECETDDEIAFCNIYGEEVCRYRRNEFDFDPYYKGNKFFFELYKVVDQDNIFEGIMDGNGNIVIEPTECTIIIGEDGTLNRIINDKWEKIESSLITTTKNPFKVSYAVRPSETSSSNSCLSSNSSNSSSSSGSQTIIVEHQRQPQPVQVWVQCTSCWGSGVCSRCSGHGTVYIGMSDKLHMCSSCGGSGRCGSCAGKGGHYEVQYK